MQDESIWFRNLLQILEAPVILKKSTQTPKHQQWGINPSYVQFSCPVCSHSYRRKGDLKIHVLEYHNKPKLANSLGGVKKSREGKPFGCPFIVCPSGFFYERDLRRHLKRSHSDYYERCVEPFTLIQGDLYDNNKIPTKYDFDKV